ncbi:Nucleotide binding alpha beta plait [Echinococcus multilocularis]|uniref:Nucleotide binding alpha beta plait n=1 Tax=Echinococcus multilocularis TaxID=6211 RepID=A0A068YF16_ECHMU|nr:Nucleotide binding alpha beta plait [Echinococcus multilocularis]
MDNGAEIDLYDNIEEDFVQESNELAELYDDVIIPPSSKPEHTSSDSKWSTDVDIQEAFSSIGIRDILEIKFHENRQNGQSKGFCVIVFGSESSVKIGMEKISKIEINGQQPVLTYCTKQSLALFEKAASNDGIIQNSSASALLGAASNSRIPSGSTSLGFSMRGSSSLMGRASSSRSAGGALSLGIPNLSQDLLMSGFSLPTTLSANPGSSLIPTPPLAIPGTSGANAHINPSFLQQGGLNQAGAVGANSLLQTQLGASVLRPQLDQFGRSVVQPYTPGQTSKISEAEFEDIMEKNKTVSSTAINRAVPDAACGNYSRAIETLVTAISLIKQSKIANDDRCKILIDSLQDTLHGIEMKSYGSKGGGSSSGGSRRRRRSYSNSGSEGDDYRGGSRHHRSSRHRSRSRSPRGSRNDDKRHRSSRNEHDRLGGRDYYGSGSPSYRESTRYRQ